MTVLPAHFADEAQSRAERLVFTWFERDLEPDPDSPGWMSAESLDRLISRVADVYRKQLLPKPQDKEGAHNRGGRLDGGLDAPGFGCPVQIAPSDEDTTEHRRPECPQYSTCLSFAVGHAWLGFSCRGCRGPSSDGAVHYAETPLVSGGRRRSTRRGTHDDDDL